MDPSRIGLFELADKRLAWVDQRQSLLAQNIANADTPGWRARDVAPFDVAMAQTGANPGGGTLVLTDPKHITGTIATIAGMQTEQGERSLDGNGVALDEQLSKVSETDSTHELVTDLYAKYLGMFRTALGR